MLKVKFDITTCDTAYLTARAGDTVSVLYTQGDISYCQLDGRVCNILTI